MDYLELVEFIKEVLAIDFEGCWYKEIGESLFLVFAYGYKEGDLCGKNNLMAKLAYNCDDLQCDYDWDWEEPTNKDGDSIGENWDNIIEKYTAEELATEVLSAYNFVIDCKRKGVKKMIKIDECWNTLENCNSLEQINKAIEDFPQWCGHWVTIPRSKKLVTVCNDYYDEDEFCFKDSRNIYFN